MGKAYLADMQIDTQPHFIGELSQYLISHKSNWEWVYCGSIQNGYEVLNIPASIDIEESSFYENGEKRATLTCWQIGIDGTAFIGRSWDELRTALSIIKNELNISAGFRLIFYVHFLGHEFQWFRHQIGPWIEIFAGHNREPYKACTTDGFELRDSFILSGLSLEATAKKKLSKYKIKKLNTWDYNKIRHCNTPLTDDEINYAIYDVLVVMAFIKECMDKEGGFISRIPMTRTGYVRRDCRKATIGKSKKYKKLIKSLELGPKEYKNLKQAYQGGFTHANHNYVGKTLNNCGSFDFTSSYPAVMVCEKFPMGLCTISSPKDGKELQQWMDKYCCMIHVSFKNISPLVDFEHIISSSKCVNLVNSTLDNGRIVKADVIELWCTELDFKMILKFYKCTDIIIHEVYLYYKKYLPTELVDRILYYYENKTKLKGISGQETLYSLSKEMVNAIYGMMVQDVVRDEVSYLFGDWNTTQGDPLQQIDDYNRNLQRFTYYPWGVWITAYARYNLLCGILAAKDNFVYSDTDSIKYRIKGSDEFLQYISRYNDMCKQKMENAMAHHGFPLDRWNPLSTPYTDEKGKYHPATHYPLGYWDPEKPYRKFKTLGAKRYFVQYRNGKYMATVAGANKYKITEYLTKSGNPFKKFSDGAVVPKTHSGRIISTYIDSPIEGDCVDYLGNSYHYKENSCIHMENSEYTMSLSEAFRKYLMGGIDINILE